MNFEDEHYVRLYTRDTKTWLRWGWEGQCVFALLLRKLDKSGVLDDIDDPVEDVALLTGIPVEVVQVGLPKVLSSDAMRIVGNCLVAPRYIEAQTARKSDALRAKESRDRRRAVAINASRFVTDGHEMNTGVTPCDASERDVTSRDAVTECDEPSQSVTRPSRNEAKRSTADQPRHSTQINADQRNAGGDPPPTERRPANRSEAERIPIRQRAQLVIDNPHDGDWLDPHKWPEVILVVSKLHEAAGLPPPKLGRYAGDSAVRRAIELFASGVTVEEILHAIPHLVAQDWWTQKPRDFGAITPSVLRRATPAARKTKPDDAEARRRAARERQAELDARAAAEAVNS